MMSQKISSKKGKSAEPRNRSEVDCGEQSNPPKNILPDETDKNDFDLEELKQLTGVEIESKAVQKSLKKKQLGASNHQNAETCNRDKTLRHQMAKNKEELKQSIGGEIGDDLLCRLNEEVQDTEQLNQANLSVIRELSHEDDQKLETGCSLDSELSVLDNSKDANKFVEEMNNEMKRLLKEFTLIKEKSFLNEKRINKCSQQRKIEEACDSLLQPMNGNLLPPHTASTGNVLSGLMYFEKFVLIFLIQSQTVYFLFL